MHNSISCRRATLVLAFSLVASTAYAAKTRDILKNTDEWFASEEGQQRLDCILSWQDEFGCWPKNKDTSEKAYTGDKEKLRGTFDNGATVGELRALAKGFRLTGKAQYRKSFLRGLECILDAQYENGGWPQRPDPNGYAQHITFNDGTMVGLMSFLRDVADQNDFGFVNAKIRRRALAAFSSGVDCILKCQIRVDEKLTVWCAQHDHETFEPRGARSYEHPSLSGGESAGIVCLLVSIEEPTEEIEQSIRAAVEWYKRSAINGIRLDRKADDPRIIKDDNAPTLWARFYEIETNRPIFSGRDGVIKYDWHEIELERRKGYAWYVNSGKHVLSGCE